MRIINGIRLSFQAEGWESDEVEAMFETCILIEPHRLFSNAIMLETSSLGPIYLTRSKDFSNQWEYEGEETRYEYDNSTSARLGTIKFNIDRP